MNTYPQQRRDKIIELLSENKFVPYHKLAGELQVSEMTIRRDLQVLYEEGIIDKVVGGAKIIGAAIEPTFQHKRVLQQREKDQIADAALDLIEPNMVIGITAGTTTWTLAKKIRKLTNLSFVTNSTNVALALQENGCTDIYLTGGYFRTPSDALVGPIAEQAARNLHTDVLFMGVHGIDLSYGISTPNVLEAAINRALMANTDRVVLVFDHTKWGLRAFSHISSLSDIDVVITDHLESGDEYLDELTKQGVKAIVV